MAGPDRFVAVSLLARSVRTSLWTARRPADLAGGPAQNVLKRVDLSEAELAAGDAGPARELLIGAALQQAMGYRSVGWVPVVDLGTNGTDAYYVAERFPRSAQTLVDAGRRVTSTELRTIVVAVVDALIDLQVMYDRPHANLKPTNVLIGERVRPGMICLTDPAVWSDPVPSLTRAPDPRAIGRLVFALVTGRPHSSARWPMEFGTAWAALGASGREWFTLCESLLHPLADVSPDLDLLLTRVVGIRPSWRRVRRAVRVAAWAAALVLVVGAGWRPLTRWVAMADRQVRSWERSSAAAPRHPSAVSSGPSGGHRIPTPRSTRADAGLASTAALGRGR